MSLETLSAIGTTLGVAERSILIVKELRGLFSSDDSLVPAELMRLALLDAEQNLAVLDVARPPRGVATDDERLFAFAAALELDTLGAMLLEWKPAAAPKKPGKIAASVLRGRRDWQAYAEAIERLGDQDRLLSLARYIVVRGRALQRLAEIPPEVRGKLRVTVRLANLRDAHLNLVGILREQSVVEALVRARPTASK